MLAAMIIGLLLMIIVVPFYAILDWLDKRGEKERARIMREYEESLPPGHPDRWGLDENMRDRPRGDSFL